MVVVVLLWSTGPIRLVLIWLPMFIGFKPLALNVVSQPQAATVCPWSA